MYPILAKLGSLKIYSYGLSLAAAFVAAYLWVRHECGRRGIAKDIAADLVLAAAIGGVVGARLAYVAAHWDYFARNLVEIAKLQQGGLVFYGGLAGGIAGVLLVVRARGLAIWSIADIAAPALALGSAIGRVGCLLNGCCYGRETTGPLGITFPEPLGGPRFATQVLDGGYNLVIFVMLAVLSRRAETRPGFVFWVYGLVYSVFRFGVEFLRENPVLIGGLSGAQLISLGVFVISVGVLVTKYRHPRDLG